MGGAGERAHDRAPAPRSTDAGLHAPSAAGPLLATIEPRQRWSLRRALVQTLGALVGVGLLVWAVSLALGEENRAQIEQLRQARAGPLVLLAALSAASVTLNGLMFWVLSRPLVRLHPAALVGVNAIATFLTVLPFKLNLLTRVLIHHRRDGMPFKDIIAWLAAVSALGLAVLAPIGAISLLLGEVDAAWLALAIGCVVVGHVCAVFVARAAQRGVWNGWLSRASLGSDRVLKHPGPVVAHAVLRSLDVVVLVARFAVGASILGVELTLGGAALLGTTYFLLSVLAPFGAAGYREVGTSMLGSAAVAGFTAGPALALLVTVAEMVVSGVMALVAAAGLRLDRMVVGGRDEETERRRDEVRERRRDEETE
jgi:hypothetical protein